jgi:hypothetical protein
MPTLEDAFSREAHVVGRVGSPVRTAPPRRQPRLDPLEELKSFAPSAGL